MKLTVPERLLVLGMQEIPRFGNVVTMRLVTDLFARTAFTEKEIADWKIEIKVDEQTGMSRVTWNPSLATDADIDITPGMAKILVSAIDRAENLPLAIVPLYDRLKPLVPEEPKKEPKKEIKK